MKGMKGLALGLGVAALMLIGLACGAGNTPASEDPGTTVSPPLTKPTEQPQAAEGQSTAGPSSVPVSTGSRLPRPQSVEELMARADVFS